MRIVQITTDNRYQERNYDLSTPYFGTAPAGLIDGFSLLDDVELHVVSCSSVRMESPEKLAPNVYFHQPIVPKLGWGRSLFLGCAWAVRQLVREIDPDIVHGQGTERDCAMGAVLSGYPNVLTIHGNMRVHAKRPEQRGNGYYKMAAALETFCLKRTGGVVAISSYTNDLVRDLARNTCLLPNAVDRRFLAVKQQRPEIPRLLFVGSLDPRKNPLGLLSACEEFLLNGDCTLAMAGQFNPETEYGRKVMSLAERLPGIEFLGFLGRDELAAQFERSTMLVLPTFEDNCPMVVLEAMAAGLPVIASRVGGVPDLVQEGVTGLMFDPNEPGALRDTIGGLLDNQALGVEYGKAGHQLASERYHPAVIAAKHVEFYQSLI